jgi:hypothetical protein
LYVLAPVAKSRSGTRALEETASGMAPALDHRGRNATARSSNKDVAAETVGPRMKRNTHASAALLWAEHHMPAAPTAAD